MVKHSAAAGGKRALPLRPRRSGTSPSSGGRRAPQWINGLVVLLLLAGGGLLLYPTLSDRYYNWQARNEIHAYYEYLDVDCDELFAQAETYNQTLLLKEDQFVLSDEEEEYISTLLNPMGNGMMGYIEIPKIDVRLPIYQGTDENALQMGAGWWTATSLPTGGTSTHCVLTAHTGLVKAKMFTDIDQLVEGDTFTLSILDRTLTYEVDQILVVEPTDWDDLKVVEGQDYVTLYTCTPYGINTHRLLVRGHRIETPAEEAASPPLWQTVLPLAIGAAGATGILVWFVHAKRHPGKRVAPKDKKKTKRGDP